MKKNTVQDGAVNTRKVKQLYLAGCRRNGIKPRQRSFESFLKLLENDFQYWTQMNMKYFFERMNY